MLYSFLLEIQHNCPFSELSRSYPEIEIHIWCNNGHHRILELKGESSALELLAKEMNIHRRTFEEHLRKAEKKL